MASNAENEFVEKPSLDFFCPVTLELLKNPRQTNSCCGHHLSRAAAEQLEAEGKPCPICKKTPLKTAEDVFFKRKVMEIKVRCSSKPAGCQWEGELGDLDHHLNLESLDGQCRFAAVECPLKCSKHIPRDELEEHTQLCSKRPFSCEYCDYQSTYREVIDDHLPKCQRFPEKCPHECSGRDIERRFLKHHLEEDCPLQEIECKFSFAGCRAKRKRGRSMQVHLQESLDTHLDGIADYSKGIQVEQTALTLAFAKYVPEPVFIPPPDITFKSFDLRKSSRWLSPHFHTHIGGYKMCLEICALQIGLSGAYVDVLVHTMKGEFDSRLQWPFKGEITVQLVNQKEGGEHYEKKLVECNDSTEEGYNDVFDRLMECSKSEQGWPVLSEFISHADLYKPEEGKEYLKNDTLKFRVTKVVVTSV